MAHTKIDNQVAQLHRQGFDRAYHVIMGRIAGRRVHAARVRCSQCEALVINGVPAHEAGCPNTVHECRGCTASVVRAGTYCQDCQ